MLGIGVRVVGAETVGARAVGVGPNSHRLL